MLRRSSALAAAVLAVLPLAACGGSSPSSGATDTYRHEGATEDAGLDDELGTIEGHGGAPTADAGDAQAPVADGAAPTPPGSTPCPGSALPTASPCVISEAYGVFVAATAPAGGDGTRAKPFNRLSAATTVAKLASKRVYVCAGTYTEPLEIQSGVSVFGYFACADGVWSVAASHARVQSPTSPAARASNITAATRVEGLDLYAPDFGALTPDAAQPAKSSIGLVASNAGALTVASATIHAGTAQRGANGADGPTVSELSTTTKGADAIGAKHDCLVLNGLPFCTSRALDEQGGRPGGASDCRLLGDTAANPALTGGPGGRGGRPAQYERRFVQIFGTDGFELGWVQTIAPGDGLPRVASAATAAGGAVVPLGATPNAGTSGIAPPPGANGASAIAPGVLGASGFTPSDGTSGSNGNPGQGGGGGAGFNHTDSAERAVIAPFKAVKGDWVDGASGAGGGAGGCAGAAGNPGRGGGSSLAVVAIDSALRLESATLETSAAGAGGRGGAGSPGHEAGQSGAPLFTSPSGFVIGPSAGTGSAGSAGGAAGSGRGGHSIAVAFVGAMPAALSPTYHLGVAGAGVPPFTSPAGTVAASAAGLQAQTQKF